MENFGYYIFVLVYLVVAFLVVKKIATCMLKTVFLAVVLAILVGAYWLFS